VSQREIVLRVLLHRYARELHPQAHIAAPLIEVLPNRRSEGGRMVSMALARSGAGGEVQRSRPAWNESAPASVRPSGQPKQPNLVYCLPQPIDIERCVGRHPEAQKPRRSGADADSFLKGSSRRIRQPQP
jgi:hypothetical protein